MNLCCDSAPGSADLLVHKSTDNTDQQDKTCLTKSAKQSKKSFQNKRNHSSAPKDIITAKFKLNFSHPQPQNQVNGNKLKCHFTDVSHSKCTFDSTLGIKQHFNRKTKHIKLSLFII